MRRLLVVFFLFQCISHALAQTGTFTFTNYTTANGLADNAVSSILQDSRGFMWFGTREGLSRFDGNNFRNFYAQKEDSTALPNNNTVSLQEYAPAQLLMISGGKLTALNTINKKFSIVPLFRNRIVQALFRLDENRFSVSMLDTCIIINNKLEIAEYIVPPTRQKKQIIVCREVDKDFLLIGSTQEYYLYNKKTKKFFPFINNDNISFGDRSITFLYTDTANNWLYFSNYNGGLYKYSLKGELLHNWKRGPAPDELPNTNLSFIRQKSDSVLWIGNLEGSGLMILNTHSNQLNLIKNNKENRTSLAGNSVTCDYIDQDGNEWFATITGISKLNRTASNIKSWKNELTGITEGTTPLSIKKGADQNFYLSAFGTGICFRINKQSESVSMLRKEMLPNTWCMNSFGEELVFTGGGPSFTTYNPRTDQYRRFDFLKPYFPNSDVVILAFKHSNGDQWFSGNNGGGLVRIDAKDGSFHHFTKGGPGGNFSSSYYGNYTEDNYGNLWFGVNKSALLLFWDKKRDLFHEISLDTVKGITGKSLSGISDITHDNENNIWIAFDGSGVIRYNPINQTGIQYTIQDGLPTNYVYSLMFDGQNRLWIGSLKGLSCLLVKQNRFINFNRENGMPEDYFNERCIYYDSSANKLWIGSQTTLMNFVPDDLLKNSYKKIAIYIDDIKVNGHPYTGEDFEFLHFSPSENNIQFYFAGPDINSGNNLEYSYKLTGADADWVNNYNITTASYANLNPGKYTFFVRVRHKGDTDWNEIKYPLTFVIASPWFKTWWFRLLLAFVIAALTWLSIRNYYRRKLEKQKMVLEKKQAVEKERTRIATDMHDDFGASLSRIKFLSEKLQLQQSENQSEHNDLEKISLYSDEMAEKMNEIVWALNQRYDSLGDLVSFCRSYASEYLQDKNIKLHFQTSEMTDTGIQGEVRRNIFLVIKEALHNIVKHAGASEVTISFRQNNKLHITVSDNGKGFDSENIRPFANGLENMKKRIRDINGSFEIESQNGTNILLIVPI